jgi:hypothetical protein
MRAPRVRATSGLHAILARNAPCLAKVAILVYDLRG